MTDLIPAARPVPSPEDRMRDARTDREYADRIPAPRPLTTDRTNSHHRDLHQHIAGLENDLRSQTRAVRELAAERDQARQLNNQLAEVIGRKQDTINAQATELGAAGEVLAVVRDAAERIDRALAVYDTTPGETATVNLGQHRRLRREAPNGCDHCSVEPGESHRYPGCPGATQPSSVPPRRAQEPSAADLLRQAAAGRREYAKGIPEKAEPLDLQAHTLEAAACVVEGDLSPLYDWLPSWKWTDEMHARLHDGRESS